jgi:hypothetical protein
MRTLAVIALLPFAAACGSSAAPGDHFVGTWSFASGTNNVSCPNGNTAQTLTGNVTIKPATDGGLVVLDGEGCNFAYAVAGDAATLMGKSSCQFAVPQLGQGVTANVSYDAITLATSDGKMMTDTFTGKVAYTSSQGTLDCVFSGSAMLKKVSDQ